MATSWLIWQIVDSAFPTGGFVHSSGLEAAWQQGEVDPRSLPSFVRDVVRQAGHSGLPFVTAAHRDPDSLPSIDAHCEAFLRNPIVNRASRLQGRAWLGTVERAFPQASVRDFCETVRASTSWRHYTPLFGATLHALDIDAEVASRAYLFGVCRGALSAAVRLGIVGTTDAQRVLGESGGHLNRTLERCATLTIDEAAQTAPLVDLWQSAHDRLYSRLFQS